MRYQISGRQIDVGEALQAHVSGALAEATAKYAGRPTGATVVFSRPGHGMACEIVVHLSTGLTAQANGAAADAYAALSEFSGQPACVGSGTALGPVDAYLAMAAEATGERALATRHADDAARLCEEWRIPLAAQWFADLRSRFGF